MGGGCLFASALLGIACQAPTTEQARPQVSEWVSILPEEELVAPQPGQVALALSDLVPRLRSYDAEGPWATDQADHADPDYAFEDHEAVLTAMGEEPLQIIGRIARDDLPWTEVVLGDWTMVDPVLAGLGPGLRWTRWARPVCSRAC